MSNSSGDVNLAGFCVGGGVTSELWRHYQCDLQTLWRAPHINSFLFTYLCHSLWTLETLGGNPRADVRGTRYFGWMSDENRILLKKLTSRDIASLGVLQSATLGLTPGFAICLFGALEKWRWQCLAHNRFSDFPANFGLSYQGFCGTKEPVHIDSRLNIMWMVPPGVVQKVAHEGPIHTDHRENTVWMELCKKQPNHSFPIHTANKCALNASHEPGTAGGWWFSWEQADKSPVLVCFYPSPYLQRGTIIVSNL